MSKKGSILVTGGCGFVGTNLVPSLAKSYEVVRILDNLSIGSFEALKRRWPNDQGESRLEFVCGDVRERYKVEDVVQGVDAVVHLAAQSGVASSIENPYFDYSVNVLGTFNVLDASRQAGVTRVVFASSNAAAGEQSPPVREIGTPRPISPYGASKLAAEGYCSAYQESFDLGTVALRFANAYGPNSTHKTSVVARFLSLALADAPITVYGDGSQTRDFVFVEDLCQAIRLALREEVQGGVYQIGTGVETSVNELIYALENTLGKGLVREYLSQRRGEVQRMYLDISKARKLLGYAPQFTLADGIENTCRWFIEQT